MLSFQGMILVCTGLVLLPTAIQSLLRPSMHNMNILTSTMILIFLCHDDASAKTKTKAAKVKAPQAIKNTMGDKVQTVPYDNTGFDSKKGQTTSPQDLSCNSDSPCCWKEVQPPYSTVDFVRGSGKIEAKKFKKNFGTTEQPTDDNFLIASMDKGSEDSNKAELQSCLIKCSSSNVQVSLKHWTKGTKIRVCQVAESNPTQLIACQDLPGSGPGPDTIDLPPADNVYIVVDAYNFVEPTNNVAIVQGLTASYTPCQSTLAPMLTTQLPQQAQSQTAPLTNAVVSSSADCQKAACNFEKGMCGYAPGSADPSKFQSVGPGKFNNGATDSSRYVAAYLKPGQKATMESTVANLFADSDRQIKFQEYKATIGITTRGCCDSTDNCPYQTSAQVKKDDFRQWFQGAITCKRGTKKVVFVAENKADNEGAVGFDNIQVFDVGGQNQIC